MPVQHGQQHGEPVLFETDRQAPWARAVRGIDEGLDLHQQGPGSFLGHEDAGAGNLLRVLGEKDRRGIAHAAQAAVRHGEDTKLVYRAKAVLEGSHQAEGGVGIALEVKHCVDDVLEHPGTRK